MVYSPDHVIDRYKSVLVANAMWDTIFGEKYLMNLDPELETFFIAVLLQHGTPLMPAWGVERARLASVLTEFIAGHPGKPAALEKVRQNYIELGGNKVLLETKDWFFGKIADAYLDWLYSQPESVKLQAEAMKTLDKVVLEERTRRGEPPWRKY